MTFWDKFKPKEGGTLLGNFGRWFINQKTDGAFGNGNMMLQPGESVEQWKNRLLSAAGSAASAYNQNVTAPATASTPLAAFKGGVKKNIIKSLLIIAVPGGLFIALVIWLIKKYK